MKGFFITGTDTGVGKTVVTAALVRLLRSRGRRVVVSKPVATGARRVGDQWLSDDTLTLAAAADMTTDQVTRWTFAEAVAPPVAARIHGVTLSIADMTACVRESSQRGDITLVEGIGGLLCPLTDRETVADLAADLGLPLLVVTRISLGTLNHTLLTLEVARRRGLPVVGVIANATTSEWGLAEATNIEELRSRCHVPVLAAIPHLADPERDVLPFLQSVDWEALSP